MTTLEASAQRYFFRQFFSDPVLGAFYGSSGFGHIGYWDEDTLDAAEAGRRLVSELLALAPDASGELLDVACGRGGGTQQLASRFEPAAITALGEEEEQRAEVQGRVPGCRFLTMDGPQLPFADASFDAVVCVEAAFRFRTREDFLREASRVLRPGGTLLLSDLLLTPGAPLVPAENQLPGLSAYGDLLERCGFGDVSLVDVTRQTWHAYRRRLNAFVLARFSRWGSRHGLRTLWAANAGMAWSIRTSLLAAARKPSA